MKEEVKVRVKTYRDWEGNLNSYLQIGDIVDEEMVQYFINCLPPATMRSDLVQMGEPFSHINGRGTFATLDKTEEGWKYRGHCFQGERYEALCDNVVHDSGHDWEGMVKISPSDAIYQFLKGEEIYILYEDDNEDLVERIEQILPLGSYGLDVRFYRFDFRFVDDGGWDSKFTCYASSKRRGTVLFASHLFKKDEIELSKDEIKQAEDRYHSVEIMLCDVQ